MTMLEICANGMSFHREDSKYSHWISMRQTDNKSALIELALAKCAWTIREADVRTGRYVLMTPDPFLAPILEGVGRVLITKALLKNAKSMTLEDIKNEVCSRSLVGAR